MMTDRRLRTREDLQSLRFDDAGLVPVIAQDVHSGAVLMVAWANREALERTLETGTAHYWSRSRDGLWRKGETSGNTQSVASLHADCDGDTVLALVDSSGPACHTGEPTCFGAGATPEPHVLGALWETLELRAAARPEDSYTAFLLSDENERIKKLGEETAELVLALARGEPTEMAEEAADLVYHMLVALLGAGASLDGVLETLERRRNRHGGHG